ncbi:MAG: hypothetical protein IK008_02890 [Bacteroidales bacterium]|nr:hypothetical protein [Bacteroidales bacterium]
MKRIVLSLFISGMVMLPFRAGAQSSAAPLEWNSRKLTFSDYIESGAKYGNPSNTSIQWKEKTTTFRAAGCKWLRIKYSDINNTFLPQESWMRGDLRTPSKLAYEQLKFDLSEYYCRKVELEVNHHGGLKRVMNSYRDSLATAVKKLAELTDEGSDERAVDSLSVVLSNHLSGTSIPYSDITAPEVRGIVWGVSLHALCSFRLGGSADLLPSPVPRMEMEVTAGYGRCFLSAGLSFQASGDWLESQEAFAYNGQAYPRGARCEDTRYYGLFEYTAWEKPRFQLKPFVGAGITHLTFMPRENLQPITRPLFLAGVSVDYRLSSFWNLPDKRLTSILLRGRVYVTKDQMADYSGCSINVGIGITPLFYKTR